MFYKRCTSKPLSVCGAMAESMEPAGEEATPMNIPGTAEESVDSLIQGLESEGGEASSGQHVATDVRGEGVPDLNFFSSFTVVDGKH
eukprot:766055-Hanusia_phi.AAC.9